MLIGAIVTAFTCVSALIYGLIQMNKSLRLENDEIRNENENLRLRKMSEELSDSELNARINSDIDKLK